jgi:acyl carrier protein
VNHTEIFDQVSRILAEMFEIDPGTITPQARLYEDLDLDSIDAIDLAAKMQGMIGKRVDEKDLRELRTVEDVVGLIERAFQPTS